MNSAHWHLVVNHFPVVGMILASGFLAVTFWIRDRQVTRAGLIFVVIVGLWAIPAFLTGEPAEEVVEHLPGIMEPLIETHEEAAEIALWATLATSAAALVGLIALRRNDSLSRRVILIVFVLTLIANGLLGWTANLGGEISHPEIRSIPAPASHEK